MEKDLDEPELFLILHKVRGKPAFDIAHQLEIGDEIGWIIPTSGHRAYPWWSKDISKMFNTVSFGCPIDPDWPDHYATLAAPKAGPIRNILAIVGIKPKPFRLKP